MIRRAIAVIALAGLVLVAPQITKCTAAATPRSVVKGSASYVDASYGPRYLALPVKPVGVLVVITGRLGQVARRSTDYGPDQGIYPNRVADLSRADFLHVCGSGGTCPVTVEYFEPTIPAVPRGSVSVPKLKTSPPSLVGATLPPTSTDTRETRLVSQTGC